MIGALIVLAIVIGVALIAYQTHPGRIFRKTKRQIRRLPERCRERERV